MYIPLSIFATLILQSYGADLYPGILTPPDDHFSAIPNTDHASIQYGDSHKADQVLTKHYSENGYDNYPEKIEDSDGDKIGLKDVIHSVGALLSIFQTFPKFEKSFENKYIDQQKYGSSDKNQGWNTENSESQWQPTMSEGPFKDNGSTTQSGFNHAFFPTAIPISPNSPTNSYSGTGQSVQFEDDTRPSSGGNVNFPSSHEIRPTITPSGEIDSVTKSTTAPSSIFPTSLSVPNSDMSTAWITLSQVNRVPFLTCLV